MSLEKSQIKILMSQNLGKDLESTKEELEQKLQQRKGGVEALHSAAKRISELNDITEREFKDGKYDDLLKDPLSLTKFIKQKITQAVHVIDNLATTGEVAFYKLQGEIVGVDKAIVKIKRIYDEEHGKVRAIHKALQDNKSEDNTETIKDDGPRGAPSVTGVHPGLTLKHKRLLEKSLEDKKKTEEKKSKAKSTKKSGKKKAAEKKSQKLVKSTAKKSVK